MLAALMAVRHLGWRELVDLRLDNDGAVARGGGLVLAEQMGEEVNDELLDLDLQNADIWYQFREERRQFRAGGGGTVRVEWHPGHPERRKARRSDWSFRDRAIFRADFLAEQAHKLRDPSRERPQWGDSRDWQVVWRGLPLQDNLRVQLTAVVRVELLGSYVESVRQAVEVEEDWLDPELAFEWLDSRASSLGQRVFKAKLLSMRLPTQEEKVVRGDSLEEDQGRLCRLCGEELESQTHALWRCRCGAAVEARRKVCKEVAKAWRRGGLSEKARAVVGWLWELDELGAALGSEEEALSRVEAEGGVDVRRCMSRALIRHVKDASGLELDRAGFFWQRLG